MFRIVRRTAIALLTLLSMLAFRTAAAQDFRVFTVVYDLSGAQDGERAPVIARAATLFHAGKVYDYIDAADEVIVYEPTARQFRVLNTARGLVATVDFDEITRLLKIAREETEKHAADLAEHNDHKSLQAAALLRFQLQPRFEETFDEATGMLTLDGGVLQYEARTALSGRPGVTATYLEYADRMHQLNYLLHPGPILPEARLALNQALRSRDRLPKQVELGAEMAPPLRMRAEHSLNFELNKQDRALIHQWESQFKSASLKEVPLREYQRTVLTAKAR